MKERQDIIDRAVVYLDPSGSYPAPIKTMAIGVIKGEQNIDSLISTVAAFDSLKEAGNSQAAQDQTSTIGDTAGQQVPALSDNGEINSELDFENEISSGRAALGYGG